MSQYHVNIPTRQQGGYTITIASGTLSTLWSTIEADFPGMIPFVVTDENLVEAGHLSTLLADREIKHFVISPAGEASKNVNTLISILKEMEAAYLGRDTLVVALGGGTVGDIAGFAASVFKRGVPVIQIPTTTVAQADSSIGGKTGVDSNLSKNAFGTFWHPAAVYIDVATLTTLEDRQFRAGLVESVKHAVIADRSYFEFLEQNIDAILERKSDVLEEMALFNCKIKASVVEADPTEKNQRRVLNYGHTIGHAVESASGYGLLHGEAVAIGMIAAGLIEIELGLGSGEKLSRIRKMLEKIGQPVTLTPDLAEKNLIDLVRRDKKAINRWPRFVLTDEIGNVYHQDDQWAVEVEQKVVETVLDKLCM